MKIRSRMTGVALVVSLSAFGTLAACGSDSDDEETNNKSTSQPSEEADSTNEESDNNNGDKPSKDEVVAGYTTVITDTMGTGLPEEIVSQVVNCFVDELYDTASADTLQAIADSDPAGVNPDDAQLFSEASTTCTQQIAGQ